MSALFFHFPHFRACPFPGSWPTCFLFESGLLSRPVLYPASNGFDFPVLQMVASQVASSDSLHSPHRSLRSLLLLPAGTGPFSPGVLPSQIQDRVSTAPASMCGSACQLSPATLHVMSSPGEPAQSESEHSGAEAPPGSCHNEAEKVGADHTHIFRFVHWGRSHHRRLDVFGIAISVGVKHLRM
jgi:hypothetical protein